MLLGIKDTKTVFIRHFAVASIGAALVYLVWQLNGTWSPDMRLWKAFGGGSLFLLWFAVFIGPASVIFPPLTKVLSFRREAGIWFFLISAVHVYLILDGWVRWSVWQFFGYQFVPQLDIYMRAEPGFGLANLIGAFAIFFALLLAATSSDKMVNLLGVSSWKWLHMFAYVVFYLVVLHVLYYAFIHFSPSLLRAMQGAPYNYPPNPLKYYYLVAFLSVFVAQVWAFLKTVKKHKNSSW